MATKEEIMLERFIQRLGREPLDIQHTIVRYADNVMNGCNWAFISNKSISYRSELESFKKSSIVTVYEVKNGVLITTPLETILSILTRVSPELYTKEAKEAALNFRKKSVENFVSFLRSGVKEAKIGIFNLNDSPNITVNGKIYKAFNMDLANVAMFLKSAGYSILIEGKKLPAQNVLVPERYPIALKKLELAPSGNGLLLDIVKG